MDKLQEFQGAAREGGFVAAEETEEGSVVRLKRATAEAEDRMCIDSLTKSATVYWVTMPWKINSKTFREVAALQEWILARPGVIAS